MKLENFTWMFKLTVAPKGDRLWFVEGATGNRTTHLLGVTVVYISRFNANVLVLYAGPVKLNVCMWPKN